MQRLAPIVLFVYRRIPSKTIASLLENKEASKSELFIFSDGYKDELDKQDVLAVREYVQTIKGFKSLHVELKEQNHALAKSVIEGVSKVIAEYKKVIVLEDDLIVSEDFLEYMNEALCFYEQKQNIWAISGYTPKLPCLKKYDKDVYLSPRANSWGWATWQNRWEGIDWEVSDWQEFKKDARSKKEFDKGGDDMFKMLELQMLGKIDSWAIRWCYAQFRKKAYCVYPKYSKVQNIGFDNKATHNSGNGSKWASVISSQKINLETVEIDSKILKCFRDFYSLSAKTKIGYFLRKYGGYNLAKRIWR